MAALPDLERLVIEQYFFANRKLEEIGAELISKLLKEGRKHHIDVNFATQYVTDMKQSRMMKQASLSVYFKPDLASRASVATMLGMKKSEIYKLDELDTGECFVQGTVYNFEAGCLEDTVISGKTYLLPDSPLENSLYGGQMLNCNDLKRAHGPPVW